MNKIAKLLVESGSDNGNMRYACGFSAPDAFVCIVTETKKYAMLSPLEFARAKKFADPGVELIAENDIPGRTFAEKILRLGQNLELNGFIVPSGFSLLLADRLREGGMIVKAQEDPFFADREFKTEAEVALIIESQRAAEAGLAAAIELLRHTRINDQDYLEHDGKILTSERLRFEIDSTMLALGMLPEDTICAGGVQGSQPHNTGSGPLKAHAPIVMDIFPKSAVHGYWGDLTRTVVRGTSPELVRKAYDAVREARDAAKAKICIGANPADLHNLAAATMEKRGFHTGNRDGIDFGFFHGLGHGVGLDIHEQPRISPRNQRPLKGGEVFTIEPGLYYPEWGGIRIEDLIYLHQDGQVQCLTEAPTELEIL